MPRTQRAARTRTPGPPAQTDIDAMDGAVELCDRDWLFAELVGARLLDEGQAAVTPDCRWCGSSVVQRRSPGGAFFGCSSFPRCRYTRPLSASRRLVLAVAPSLALAPPPVFAGMRRLVSRLAAGG